MDKQPNKISIKINGQEKVYQEQKNETKKQDETINVPSVQEEFSWVLPEEKSAKVVSIEDLRHVKSQKKPNMMKESPVWKRGTETKHAVKKVVLIMSVAILVGTGLGMFSLKLMTGEGSIFAPEKAEPVDVPGTGLLEEPKETGEATKPAASAALPALTLYAVQAGVFSTKQAGEEAVRNMRAKGYAAAAVQNEKSYALFIGIGLDEKVIKEAGEHYKQQGENIYVKPYDIPAVHMKEWSETERKVMAKAQVPFHTLLSLSAETLSNPAVSLSELKGVKEELVQLKSTDKLNENIGKFLSYLLMAEASLSNYEKNQEDEAKWQTQQFLLDAVNVYPSLTGSKTPTSKR
jgi:stage II sporulation protein B